MNSTRKDRILAVLLCVGISNLAALSLPAGHAQAIESVMGHERGHYALNHICYYFLRFFLLSCFYG